MDIEYKTILPKDARDFPEFMLPHILNDKDFDKFFYHIAIINDNIVGMLVESGTVACPEILSLGVSPTLKKKGIASGLISYAIDEIKARISAEDLDVPNTINVRLTAPVGKLTALRHLFDKFGFKPYMEGSYYKVTISMLENNQIVGDPKVVKKTEKLISENSILPLSKVSGSMINAFNNKLAKESFPEINTSILDERLTFFGTKDGAIDSCILFEKQKGNEIYNLLLYSEGDKVYSSKCGYLLTAAASAAQYLPAKTNLLFWIGNEDTSKMMAKIFPKVTPAIDAVEMELPL
ncbi:MAG: GNAT family N-acetyltransferase [Lachnospiraceae bacterium]|nr:GNAT family N-acetyltransferase [Lachnospiraceae bacterium]